MLGKGFGKSKYVLQIPNKVKKGKGNPGDGKAPLILSGGRNVKV